MEVHLSPELQAKVERAAAENKSGAEEYVKQLVEHYARLRGVPDARRGRHSDRSNVSQVNAASLGHPPPLKTFSESSNTSGKKMRPPLSALPRPSTKVPVR
jgi:hypothetical protein